jgi:SWI/SNF-related matrix-associated actin-dependent regulator of chromatin subfamily A3
MTGDNGKKILELPERKEYQQWLTFREDERVIYDSIKTAVAAKVNELKKQKQLGKNYATVLQEAMRLRQICDHVDLIKSGPVEEDYDGTVMDYDVAVAGIEANGLNQARGVSIIAYLKDTDAARCVECDQELADRFPSLTLGDDDLKPEMEDKPEADGKTGKRGKKASNPVLTACQHIYCRFTSLRVAGADTPGLACFKKAVCPTYPKNIKGVGRPCSACGKGLRLQYDVLEIAPPGTQDDVAEAAPRPPRKRYQRPPGEKPTLSTKMQYLLEKLLYSSRVNKHSKNYSVAALQQLSPEEKNADDSPIEIKTVVL